MARVRLTTMVFTYLMLSVLLLRSTSAQLGPLDIIRGLIKKNLHGEKVVHEVQRIDFDPDVSDRRRLEFEAKNGVLGADLIESFGLGEDGRQEERRRQQKARDKAAGY